MSRRAEIVFKCGPLSETLFLQKWTPDTAPWGTVLITHGVAEHSECYHATALSLNQKGLEVWGWDLPGHGRSYGARGYVDTFSDYTDRLLQVATEVLKSSDKKPFFLLGHSLGGLIALQFALKNPEFPMTAYCLSSPALGVTVEVPFLKDQAARILMRVAPRLTIPHQIIYEDLTRDHEMIKTYYKDPLRHNKFSAPLYLGILEAMRDTHARVGELQKPLLIQAAGKDRIVDTLATQEFFNRLSISRKRLEIYPDSYHEIFNDLNKQEVIDDFVHFLREF